VEYLGLTDQSNEEIISYLKEMEYKDLADACQAAEVSVGAVCDAIRAV
jgi:hypothetical protein